MNGTYSVHIGNYTVFFRKSEEKSPLGRPRHRWEDHIEMVL
jgi:hypothetical protein